MSSFRYSVIRELFEGRVASVTQCSHCNRLSSREEACEGLQLALSARPPVGEAEDESDDGAAAAHSAQGHGGWGIGQLIPDGLWAVGDILYESLVGPLLPSECCR